jgi:hypothetical protein
MLPQLSLFFSILKYIYLNLYPLTLKFKPTNLLQIAKLCKQFINNNTTVYLTYSIWILWVSNFEINKL